MNYFFDFDGTIVDIKCKYIYIYEKYVQIHGGIALNTDLYWNLRRNLIPLKEIMTLSGLSAEHEQTFKEFTQHEIENSEVLKLDTLFVGVIDMLKLINIDPNNKAYLVTMRRNRINLLEQINSLNISGYFEDIILPFDMHNVLTKMGKKEAISFMSLSQENGIILGDTEGDITAGKELGFITVGVTSGLRSKEIMENYCPDRIIDSIVELQFNGR